VTTEELIVELQKHPGAEVFIEIESGFAAVRKAYLDRPSGGQVLLSDFIESEAEDQNLVDCPKCGAAVAAIAETACKCGQLVTSEYIRFHTSQIP